MPPADLRARTAQRDVPTEVNFRGSGIGATGLAVDEQNELKSEGVRQPLSDLGA
jgi:hypothetical protein